MSLQKYWDKRDFGKTPEPRGQAIMPGEQLSFTIQKHHARRLHYDFRLELNGTLKSWAIPKGPSLDPKDKRLAVHVEDHPLDYGNFEGDIPEHQYGAGHVIVWDRGIWIPDGDPDEGYRRGNLKFHLEGDKLTGGWALVRMGRQDEAKENWLLIKERDAAARSGPEADITARLPDSVLSGASIRRERGNAGDPAGDPAPDPYHAAPQKAAKKANAVKSAKTSRSAPPQKATATARDSAAARAAPREDRAGRTNAFGRRTEGDEKLASSGTASMAANPAAAGAAGAAGAADIPDTSTQLATTSSSARTRPSPGRAAQTRSSAGKAAFALPTHLQAMLRSAPRAALPVQLSPQLATLTDRAPSGDDWLSEIKFDGYRALTRIDHGTAHIYTRAGNDWTDRWHRLSEAAAALPVQDAWLDGEVVALDEEGRISFAHLQNMARTGTRTRLAYYVFDLMHLNGHDLRALPLASRKALLAAIVGGAGKTSQQSGLLLYSDHLDGHADEAWRHACMHGMEGIVIKRADSRYAETRTRAWLKLKCQERQEFVIGGYTDPQGSREAFGALLLGVYDAHGADGADGADGVLHYAGRVGTGFDSATLRTVKRAFQGIGTRTHPFAERPPGSANGVHWLQPTLVAEVKFAEWTAAGVIRHATFVGLRSDKAACDVRREVPQQPAGKDTGKAVATRTRETASRARVAATDKTASAETGQASRATANKTGVRHAATPSADRPSHIADSVVAGVNITHPTRILFPGADLTKLMLARYYEAVADVMLPHLAGRPLTLVRCPQGAGKECFFQKHANATTPGHVERIAIPEDTGHATYMTIGSLTALIGTVQMGVLELHTWGARAPKLDKPDRMTFDLDPAPELPWSRVVEAARLMRAFLQELGLESWVKTTGGKGLHVVAPIAPQHTWEVIKPFTQAIAAHFESTLPDHFTARMTKSRRTGRIFIDYLRNGWEATAVAAFSTRSRDGAPVSVPIAWDELSDDVADNRWTVETVVPRLRHLGTDPWKDYFSSRQRVTATMLKRMGLNSG